MLSLGIGGLQMMLDRGQNQDWFSSGEIIVEAVLGGLGVYLFIVHMFTGKRPFIPPALFTDRNFASGLAMMFAAGTILVSSSSLMAPWLQNLANYPVETAGLLMAPRGIGTMAAMMLAGRLSSRDRSAQDHRGGDPAAGLVDLGDDALDAGYRPGADRADHHGAGRRPGLHLHPVAGDRLRHAGRRNCAPTARRCSACSAISARRSACR